MLRLRRSSSTTQAAVPRLRRSISPAIRQVAGEPILDRVVRAAERRKMLSLGREPQDRGDQTRNEPRRGDRSRLWRKPQPLFAGCLPPLPGSLSSISTV